MRWAAQTADSPGDHSYDPGWWEDGMLVGALGLGLGGKEMGQGVGMDVLGAGTECQGEIESAKQEGPARLPGTEPLCIADIGQILVDHPDKDGMLGPLLPVPPHLKGRLDGQKFPVPHVIVSPRPG